MPTTKIPTSLENDLLFKETLAHPENRDKLIYFLACFTNFSEEYLNSVDLKVYYESILLKSKLNYKGLRSDILIEFANYKINIECYSQFYAISFNKSLVYIMRIYSTSLKKGDKNYESLDHVIGINLIDNVPESTFMANKLASNLTLIYNNELLLNDHLSLDFYRLDLARKLPYNEANKKTIWLKFIEAKNYEERKEIAKGDEKLMELNEWVEEYINDEKTNQLLREWDLRIAKDTALAEERQIGEEIGIAKGQKIGILKGQESNQKKIIQNMLKNNFSLEQISLATNLSLKEIKKIKNKAVK